MAEELIRSAIEYLKFGFSVVPLNFKKPLVPWKDFQSQRLSEDEVRRWPSRFGDKLTGVGIVTGAISGGLGVLDFERGAKVDSFELPKTIEVDTGGGGKHFYYRLPRGVSIGNHIKFETLSDFKGEGGYVVAPPSLHESGMSYRWVNSPGEVALTELPEWAVKKFARVEKRENQTKTGTSVGFLGGVDEGSRNETATKIAGKLFGRFPPAEWEGAVWPIMEFWNSHNHPPLDPAELRSVFESIAKRASHATSDKVPITLSELMKETFPEASYIVGTLIPAEGLTIISGEGGVFKSLLAYYMALQVALGEYVFGRFKTNKSAVLIIDEDNGLRNLQNIFKRLIGGRELEPPIDLLVGTGDKISQQWAERILSLVQERSIGMVIVDSLFRLNPADENDAKGMADLMGHLKKFKDSGVALVLIHHNRKTGLKTFDSQEMRGSSVFRDAADSHLAVKRLKDKLPEVENGTVDAVLVTQTKNKLGREADPFEVTIVHRDGQVDLTFRTANVGERKVAEGKEFILGLLKDGRSNRQSIVSAGNKIAGASIMDKALKELLVSGQITMEKGAHNQSIYGLPDSF